MIFQFAILAVFFAILRAESSQLRYEDNVVLRCQTQTRSQLDFLFNSNFDFWAEPRRVGAPVDFMVKSSDKSDTLNQLHQLGIQCSEMISDVQKLIDSERSETLRGTETAFLESYHNYTDVYTYFDELANQFPNLATTKSIGKTYLGKDIKIISISTDPSQNKPALWFDSGLHAREWITVATMTYVVDTLLKNSSSDSKIASLLSHFDVLVAPILNVDGYDYTWTTDRMWRKTRQPNAKSSCVGTDPNRNWNFHWGEAGASPMACSDSFQGPAPASEPEVASVQSFLCGHGRLVGYVNFHSYSQTWMSPWGYTSALPVDYPQQDALSQAVVAAIKSTHGTVFEYGPIAKAVYPASGSSADFTYGVCGIKYSYGAELRDTGEYGFMLPANQIIPSGEEILAGILAMGEFIKNNP